ncbi:MAG: PDZ domain-containing protein [Chitinophagaceae bacterium]|nr:PDZ domain-containing protein [Chitinophagaceae bacterium]
MKKFFFPVIAILILTGYASMAQNDDTIRKQKNEQDRTKSIDEKVRIADDKVHMAEDKVREETDEKRLGDYDEIIIKKKKPDTNEKLTIEIKDDEVIVNGKPVEDFVDDEISVRVRSARHYNLIAPASPFRFPGSTWSLENGNMYNGGGMNQPFLGVMTEGSSEGAKIVSVTDNSPAAKAGLKKDDIITKINDKPVADHKELVEAISELKPDDKIAITYKRNSKESKTTAVLGKRTLTRGYRRQYMNPLDPEAPLGPDAPEAPIPPVPPMEFNFDDLGNDLGRTFSIHGRPRLGIRAQDTEDNKGARVMGVDVDSPAAKAGLKEDDTITSFDEKNVHNADELAEAARASKDKSSLKIQIKRSGKTKDLELKVPKKLKTANL